MLSLLPIITANHNSYWQEWQPVTSSETLPFSAGFSNSELGGYMDFKAFCAKNASELKTTPTYWYRLNNFIYKIGTGQVEWGCQVEGKFVITYLSTAVLNDLAYPVCLKVQSDIGNGLRVRQEPTLLSQYIGYLSNGEKIQAGLPASITSDTTGRFWIFIQHNSLRGWTSLTENKNAHINFQRCPKLEDSNNPN